MKVLGGRGGAGCAGADADGKCGSKYSIACGLAVFEDFEVFFVEARDGDAFLVSNDDVDQNVADVDLKRRNRELDCRIVAGLGRGR